MLHPHSYVFADNQNNFTIPSLVTLLCDVRVEVKLALPAFLFSVFEEKKKEFCIVIVTMVLSSPGSDKSGLKYLIDMPSKQMGVEGTIHVHVNDSWLPSFVHSERTFCHKNV